MKKPIRIIALIGMIAVMTFTCACSENKTEETAIPTDSAETVSETASESKAEASKDAPSEKAESSAQDPDDDASYKNELVEHQWTLSAVYKDGEKQNIGVQYGSIIRQTGAYLAFFDDDTFQCVLGFPGCSGTYAVENGEVTLHITKKFSGSDGGEDCDEHQALDWDHEEGSLTFDFNDITNVFIKRDKTQSSHP